MPGRVGEASKFGNDCDVADGANYESQLTVSVYAEHPNSRSAFRQNLDHAPLPPVMAWLQVVAGLTMPSEVLEHVYVVQDQDSRS